jgi:hypothetical protein
VDTATNCQNRSLASKNAAGHRGVWLANGVYRAEITSDGKTTNLGRFKSLEEAAAAYVKAKREMHPAFARLHTSPLKGEGS